MPLLLIVAPMTVSPAFLLTGIDSPVSIDSSTCELPSDDLAIDRDLVAGPDHDGVADQDLGGRNLDLAAVAQHGRHRRREVHQRADGLRRSGAGPHLQPMAEQDEDEQNGRRLVELLAPRRRRWRRR